MWLQDRRATFMVVFVLDRGLKLILRSGGTIRVMRSKISHRGTLLVMLLFGPEVVAGLIWIGEPIWCQRFLKVYFLMRSGLYLLDLVDGHHAMVRYFLPSGRNHAADGLMTRVKAFFAGRCSC